MALSDNLVAAWELNEASGNAIDSHGDNDGVETSGTIDTGTGLIYSTARDFERDDSEQFVVAHNTDMAVGDIDFTIEAWVNIESLSHTTQSIITKWNTTGNQRGFQLNYVSSTTDRFQFLISTDGASGGSIVTVNADNFGEASASTWYHVVAWHDSVNNQLGIAVNAGTADTVSHSGGVHASTADVWIGGPFVGSANYFDGLLGPLRFWKRVLSSAERTELYNSGAGRTYSYITSPPASGAGARRRRVLITGSR